MRDATEKLARLEFSVSDTGIGIPQNKLETIFQGFSQAEDALSTTQGDAAPLFDKLAREIDSFDYETGIATLLEIAATIGIQFQENQP